jgi:hypothetical protein
MGECLVVAGVLKVSLLYVRQQSALGSLKK